MSQDYQEPTEKTQASKMLAVGIFLLAAIGGIWGIFYMTSDEPPKPEPTPSVQPEPQPPQEAVPPQPEEAPAASAPIEEAPEPEQQAAEEPPPEPLPSLDESDQAVRESVNNLTATGELSAWVTEEEVIRKFVLAVNNMSKGELALKYPPIAPPKTSFVAYEKGDKRYTMASAGYRRYDTYVNIVGALDMKDVVVLYRKYYPLLESAHKELGETRKTLHAALLSAIDLMLAAPIIEGDIELVRPSVMYKYADPELEKLPAAQKLMLRMGPENARKVKQALRELRAELAR